MVERDPVGAFSVLGSASAPRSDGRFLVTERKQPRFLCESGNFPKQGNRVPSWSGLHEQF